MSAPDPRTVLHRAPTACPVCSHELITLRVGCPDCATEISGHFHTCRFCRMEPADAEVLEVFLRSRGNIRDVQAHLGVSYPTARSRLGEVLTRLGFGEPWESSPDPRSSAPAGSAPPGEPVAPAASAVEAATAGVLSDLAAGRIGVEHAESLLAQLRGSRTPSPVGTKVPALDQGTSGGGAQAQD